MFLFDFPFIFFIKFISCACAFTFFQFSSFFFFFFLNIKPLYLTRWKRTFLVETLSSLTRKFRACKQLLYSVERPKIVKDISVRFHENMIARQNPQWSVTSSKCCGYFLSKIKYDTFYKSLIVIQRETKIFPNDCKKIIFNNYRKKNYNLFTYFYITLLHRNDNFWIFYFLYK